MGRHTSQLRPALKHYKAGITYQMGDFFQGFFTEKTRVTLRKL